MYNECFQVYSMLHSGLESLKIVFCMIFLVQITAAVLCILFDSADVCL